MIFALAFASNLDRRENFELAYQAVNQLGQATFSTIYRIPCREGVGEDYWNAACLLSCDYTVEAMLDMMKQLEQSSGRVRPSHRISLDVDVIAWGENLHTMQFNPKKLPLALDVKLPLSELWLHADICDPMTLQATSRFQQVWL